MAYPYFNSYIQPYYANNGSYLPYTAQTQNAPMNIPTATNAPTTQNNGLIWVQGETGAKSYMVAPNTTVLLMDSEAQKFYLKSSDASGMPLPLRVFTYSETLQNGAETPKADMDRYITRDEFERKIAEITRKKDEVIGDE